MTWVVAGMTEGGAGMSERPIRRERGTPATPMLNRPVEGQSSANGATRAARETQQNAVAPHAHAPVYVIPAKAGIHRPQADWTYRLESPSPKRHANEGNGARQGEPSLPGFPLGSPLWYGIVAGCVWKRFSCGVEVDNVNIPQYYLVQRGA